MAESEPEQELIDEGELEKMEWEVREMAKKIREYRKTLPDNLRNTLDSALSSSHSFFPSFASGSDPLPSSSQRLTIAPGTQDQDSEQKMIQLKETVSRNAANMPKVIKRVRECVERIHRLDSLGGRTIHPAFTRRRLN
ncbi:uncharacterized protein LOC103858864 [Brassica rapa]|uniref:Uncharacterized protein n=1 Tax=Brassica campestris TaxID=3711 RepID=M4C9T9_BRACM|nr:uncharacterized protein LOC103858864 [Brassica rapa]